MLIWPFTLELSASTFLARSCALPQATYGRSGYRFFRHDLKIRTNIDNGQGEQAGVAEVKTITIPDNRRQTAS